MNYCSHCGSDQLELRIPQGDHRARQICESCAKIHYTNPKMVVGCLIVKEGEVMLCRRGIEPRMGYWNLPCGYLENGETVQQGALREVHEETGAHVALGPMHVVYNLPHADQVYLIFKAEMNSSHYELTPESTEISFFAENEVPWKDIAFSSNVFALRHYFQSRGQPETDIPALGGMPF